LARHIRLALGILLLGVVVGGCAVFTVDERATEGPMAVDVWKEQFKQVNGRSPSFTETWGFEEKMDAKVREFLRQNPEVGNSYRASNLRLFRQVTPGMTKEEVTLLLGKPPEVTEDATRMQALARQWWPAVKENAKEAWLYPGGWTLYFEGNTVTDMTRYHRAFLHP
jgi:hypothetical protein